MDRRHRGGIRETADSDLGSHAPRGLRWQHRVKGQRGLKSNAATPIQKSNTSTTAKAPKASALAIVDKGFTDLAPDSIGNVYLTYVVVPKNTTSDQVLISRTHDFVHECWRHRAEGGQRDSQRDPPGSERSGSTLGGRT